MMPIDPNRGYIGGGSCIEPYPGFHNRHHTMDIVVKPTENIERLASQYGAALRRANAALDKQLADMDRELNEVKLGSQQKSTASNTTTQSGCFIATAAFGSPYHERIDVLRCWRDVRLRQSRLTAPLVRWYYAISPPIARLVAKSKLLRFFVRSALKPTIWLISIQVKDDFRDWEDDRSLPRAAVYELDVNDGDDGIER